MPDGSQGVPGASAGPTGARRCPSTVDLWVSVACLASSLRQRDSRPVNKRALAHLRGLVHLRADPAMAGLIDRVGPG